MKLTRRPAEEARTDLNMTPMIDIVFLLIIFFLVVSELSTLQLEEITLPRADEAEPIGHEHGDHVLVNVREDGTIRIGGRSHSREQLTDWLAVESDAAGHEASADATHAPSKLHVTIRAHADTEFENVQAILGACSENGVYRMRVMATRE